MPEIALEMQRRRAGVSTPPGASRGDGAGKERFRLDPGRVAVEVLVEGARVDLGGIGKGFALDHMAGILVEWGIESALVRASHSTILATGAPPGEDGWPVGFGPAGHRVEFSLANRALGASGTGVKGEHIIDPSTGKPASGRYRTWSLAPTGAEADALSTAFMGHAPDDSGVVGGDRNTGMDRVRPTNPSRRSCSLNISLSTAAGDRLPRNPEHPAVAERVSVCRPTGPPRHIIHAIGRGSRERGTACRALVSQDAAPRPIFARLPPGTTGSGAVAPRAARQLMDRRNQTRGPR